MLIWKFTSLSACHNLSQSLPVLYILNIFCGVYWRGVGSMKLYGRQSWWQGLCAKLGPLGVDRTQVGLMLAPWTLLSGVAFPTMIIDSVRLLLYQQMFSTNNWQHTQYWLLNSWVPDDIFQNLISAHWDRVKMAANYLADISKWIFLNENVWMLIKIPQKCMNVD